MSGEARPCSRFCGEGWAIGGGVVSLAGTVISVVVKAYVLTPFAGIGTVGCAAWYWYARRVRVLGDLPQINAQLQAVDHDLQQVAVRADAAVDGARRENIELGKQADRIAVDRKEIASAERSLDEELARRRVDASNIKQTVVDLFKANEALAAEKDRIKTLLDQLLERIQKLQAENEVRRKGVADLGVTVVEIRAEEEKMMADAHHAETELEKRAREIGQAVTTLNTSANQLAELLSAHIKRLAQEREALSKQTAQVVAVDSHVEERFAQIRRYEEEATRTREQLQKALAEIEQLQKERTELLAAIRANEEREKERATKVSAEQAQWQHIVSGLQAASTTLSTTSSRAAAALKEDGSDT